MSTPGAQYFPFGQVPALSQPPVTYDIVMSKTYPRVSFVPSETGGLYQEIVEVNGDLWIITNATYDVNKLGFYQEAGTLVNCNASQNAYATVQRGLTGDAIRMYAAGTHNPLIPVIWIPVFDAAPIGTTVSPLALTAAGQAALTVNTTFNGAVQVAMTAFAINVVDVSSSAGSALVQYKVNNTTVWLVDKTGTLQIGKINPSQLNPPVYLSLIPGTGIGPIGPPPAATIGLAHDDYVDIPNNQKVTGIKTFPSTTRVMFGDGWGNIVGGPDDGVYMVSGAEILNFPLNASSSTALAKSAKAMILAGKQESAGQMLALYINTGLTPGTTFEPTVALYIDTAGNFWINGDVNVGGQLSVTGATMLSGPLTLAGTLTLNGGLALSETTVKALMNYFEGNTTNPAVDYGANDKAGLQIYYDPLANAIVLDTSNLMYIGKDNSHGIISSDNSVTITKNQGNNQVVDLSVSSSATGSALKLYHGSPPPIVKGIIQCGNAVIPMSGLGGANANAQGSGTVTLPVNFPNFYDIAMAQTGGDWAVYKVHAGSKTPTGFTIDASTPWNNTTGAGNTVTIEWIATGN